MQHVRCPVLYRGTRPGVFLAGGIANCEDWQQVVVDAFRETDLVFFDPRQNTFEDTADTRVEQIAWENAGVARSWAMVFWFVEESLCPMSLLELGFQLARPDLPVIVGIHPAYARRECLSSQIATIDPRLPIASSVEGIITHLSELSGARIDP